VCPRDFSGLDQLFEAPEILADLGGGIASQQSRRRRADLT
jgi:hypothetical protein